MAAKGIGHSWQSISRSPDRRLCGLVLSYTAYVEHADAPMRRLEAPFAGIPMILSLGPSILIDGQRRHSFVAGLDDSVTHTEYVGEQIGMQVNFTPLAARRILGLPMSELTHRVVAIEDLFGERGEELVARLHSAPGWEQRFALLDRPGASEPRLPRLCRYDADRLRRPFAARRRRDRRR